jgi:hypothetical protein
VARREGPEHAEAIGRFSTELVGPGEGGGGGGDVGPEAVGLVEEDPLGALQQQGALGVRDLAEVHAAQQGAVAVEGRGGDVPAPQLGEDGGEEGVRVRVLELLDEVQLHDADQLELAPEPVRVAEFTEAHGGDRGVEGVRVGLADAEAAAPVAARAPGDLGGAVHQPVEGGDHHGALVQVEPREGVRGAEGGEGLCLAEQREGLDEDPGAGEALHRGRGEEGGAELGEAVGLEVWGDDVVGGLGASVEADDGGGAEASGEGVDDGALAFVAEAQADDGDAVRGVEDGRHGGGRRRGEAYPRPGPGRPSRSGRGPRGRRRPPPCAGGTGCGPGGRRGRRRGRSRR